MKRLPEVETINVRTWPMVTDGRSGPTEVHIELLAKGDPRPILTLKFQQAVGVDWLIESLQKHRAEVWGER